ncbi:class I poly(R)-hydroxyalkanoic acid synthase [Chelativorans sp. YIM 93263]|uniref:class I poly(R)-hydroxyalkanoic acid synthase n=1 Tax=Chelativorans sp. YIM 93263 TaxID=2906648 RepID=UPI002378121E|nr:class I poly(R)-hydroxyalkanoic acid synthase [Chelativorans sp. YIM 93263]
MSSGKDRKSESDEAEAYRVGDPERFALNLARALEEAGKAAGAWARPREEGENRAAVEPFGDMANTFSKLAEYWLSDPTRALEAQTRLFSGYMGIWANSIRRLSGEAPATEPLEPKAGDRRFKDPDWARNAFFDFLKQTYLVTADWAVELVENTEGLDEGTRQKARFYVKQVTEALSPSNFVMTNPELLRETMESSGENLVRGMRMLAEDITAGGGHLRLRQTDHAKFELGRNLATTPGKVVARSDLAEIIQYAPTTETVLRRPLVIVPPWINKYYVLDLTHERSFIRWAVDQGHTVFVISWVNPDERHSSKNWDDYIRDGIELAVNEATARTGENKVNAVGYCVGGTMLAAALALMAREKDDRIASATFFATQVDFTHAGDLKVFVDEDWLKILEKEMGDRGYLEGNRVATVFNMLRARDLLWPYVVNNYMRGREPLPFDVLYWNADSTRLAAANQLYYLRNCYLENNLAHGRAELRGQRLSLSDVNIPVFNLATVDDHIAPAKSVYLGSKLFGGPVEFVLSGSGHIAGVINPPHLDKYHHWTGSTSPGDLEEWIAGAEKTTGSWWPRWQAWIEEQDDRRVAARKLGARDKSLKDAPGEYVLTRF